MKLTYKKGGTMGGCYKCGGKMHAAKGMKMGACYKCGGKMYGQKGMIMNEDPPVEPKITLPYNPLAPQTLSSDNTKNKIQITPTGNELAYNNAIANRLNNQLAHNNAMANRPVITATKPEQKKQESMLAPLVAEERSKMVGNLYGTPASGAVNSLGVIGENYLAENPDVAAGILATIYGGPTAGLYTKGLLSGGKALAKQAIKRGFKGLNAYGATNLITQGVPLTIAGLASMGAGLMDSNSPNIRYKDNIGDIRPESNRSNTMANLGYLSGALRLLPNPILRNLANVASGAVLGSGVYDVFQGDIWSGGEQILSPFIGGVTGKIGVGLTSKIPLGKTGGWWNKNIASPTNKLFGFSGNPIKYNKSTGSYTGITTGQRRALTDPLRGALSGANLKNVVPSSYLFNPLSYKNIASNKNISTALSEYKSVKELNKGLKSNILKGDITTALSKIREFRKNNPNFVGQLNRLPGQPYTYTPKLSFPEKIPYNFKISPIKSTAKTAGIGLLGLGAYDYALNDGKLASKMRKGARDLYKKSKKIRTVNPNRL